MAIREQAQLLREPLPRLADAKKALAAGKATFEDQILMLLHFQATQQWDRVLGHLAEAEKLSGRPGMRWVRLAILSIARKAEEAKKRYFEEAESLAKASRVGQASLRRRPTESSPVGRRSLRSWSHPTSRAKVHQLATTSSSPITSSTPPATSWRTTNNCGCSTPCGRSTNASQPTSWP